MESGDGAQVRKIAAELAIHFDRGQELAPAVEYLRQAAENALGRYAAAETIAHCTRGLTLLQTQPDTPARAQQELDLRLVLGPVLIATKGYAAREVEQNYDQAKALCDQLGETPQRFPILLGLCRVYRNQGKLQEAQEKGEQLYGLVQHETGANALPRGL